MASILRIIFITFLFTEALTWTIDLPEIRKDLFEKNERIKANVKKYRVEDFSRNDVYYYDNKDGNSLHHAESEKDTPQYAGEYGYQPYMEKKVHSIVHKGGVYLEELRKSIERYMATLQNCTTSDFSSSANLTNSTWQPRIELPGSLNLSRSMSCEEVTRSSEHVRRLADLAMLTTRELQDIKYAKSYQKVDYQRENELILKLAWFLDRLAHYTGYDPDPDSITTEPAADIINSPTPSIASDLNPLRRYYSDDRNAQPPPSPITMVNSSEEVKNRMMNCLRSNSSEPAVDRCRYPFPLPPVLEEIYNRLSTTTEPSDIAESVLPVSATSAPSDLISEETQELLIATDNRQTLPAYLTAVKQRSVRKRSIDQPVLPFLKIYTTNKLNTKKYINLEDFTRDLRVKEMHKRSLIGMKTSQMRIPENPIQNLGDYVKSKPTTHFNKNYEEAIEIKNYLEKIHHKKSLNKVLNKKYSPIDFKPYDSRADLGLKNLQKRSITYVKPPHPLNVGSIIQLKTTGVINKYKKTFDIKKFIQRIRETHIVRKFLEHSRPKRSTALSYRPMKKPRISEDPFRDISYYAKNKPTTNINPSLTQAAQARLALEQHFATGNILVIRQYGANYNPLVLNPFYFAFLRTLADS